jgi:glycosyltransferase involved in cell wall biosynthesis
MESRLRDDASGFVMTTVTPTELATIATSLRLEGDGPLSIEGLAAAIGQPTDTSAYLILGVLSGKIPKENEILTFMREWRASNLRAVIADIPRRRRAQRDPVQIVSGVVVDVTDTARTLFTTGIQRVARETLSRWSTYQAMELIVWDKRRQAFVRADSVEAGLASLQTVAASQPAIIIPFRCSFFLPEIAVDVQRASALRSIAAHSGSSTVAVGFDCIPITTAETAGPGMPGAFSRYLSTLARFNVVAPISEAAGAEFGGWRAMLAGAGLRGPEIDVVALPSSIDSDSTADPRGTRLTLGLGDGTIVLGVGSREPRKNHLNLLHASELNWQAGLDFTLVLVGGNAWETRRVDTLIKDLRRRGRKIITLAGVGDSVVWNLYALSRFTVFCSINEGFGLPVVESLSVGTPVLTSNFGSMKQLGDGKGALLVDPHDAQAMADRMSELLNDDDLLAKLVTQTGGAHGTTWDGYARHLHRLVTAEATDL